MRRIVPRFLSVFLALLILCASAFADTMYAFCKPKDYVAVRAFPTTKADYMGYLDCGDSVETTGETRKDKQGRTWIQVNGFEGDGWVCAMYLQDSPVTIEKCTIIVVSNGRSALRRSPNGKRIRWLKNGAELVALAHTDEWTITTDGYIRTEFVEAYYGAVE